MKLPRAILGTLVACQAVCLSLRAADLEYWDFDVVQSRVEIVTEDGVRPQVQLLSNPTRLVIDLPGIVLGDPTQRQGISSYVREVRIGQFAAKVTRIVVELSADYTMRPTEVLVRSLAPNRWFVQLPKFQAQSEYPLPSQPIAIAVPPPKPYPKNRLIIVVDPGHGGQDPGAIGIGGLQEKRIVIAIALQVAKLLERQGVRAILTRSDDRFVSLKGRVDIAENANANGFVSIHANSVGLGRLQVNGLETYYYDSGYSLARTIHKSILRRVNVLDRGVRRARFYVLRKTTMPATLVEVGYVTGSSDSKKLANPSYRRKMAEAIANGILEYFR